MSKIKGSISVDVIDTQTVSIDIETLTGRIVNAVQNRLEDFYIYEDKPYLETSDSNDHVETTLYNIDDNLETDHINWERAINETIHDLARESLSPTE